MPTKPKQSEEAAEHTQKKKHGVVIWVRVRDREGYRDRDRDTGIGTIALTLTA
jgi:hypothetical protein